MRTTDDTMILDVLFDLAQTALALGRLELCEDIATLAIAYDEQEIHADQLRSILLNLARYSQVH